ncbi:hypothetical protein BC829DRAFT_424699 [Chytridium lagenaria]|nr:hypothetical protein BC829DRAFT_424699 [Chytridium lagenaria]
MDSTSTPDANISGEDTPPVMVDSPTIAPPLDPTATTTATTAPTTSTTTKVAQRGAHKIPKTGPVIFVCAPHANQFVDPLPQDLAKGGSGRVFLADLTKADILSGTGTKFIDEIKPRTTLSISGQILEVLEVLSDSQLKLKAPVTHSGAVAALTKDTEGIQGTSYKIIPHVDQSEMFSTVISRLKEGGCHEGLNVKIVPCGLNYFHADKFRSRAVIEFGDPISVPQEFVTQYRQGGPDRRTAVGSLLDTIYKSLKSVAITAPDYETLMVLQAARRLYKPIHRKLTLDQNVAITRRFVEGFHKYRSEPAVQDLFVRVQEYNRMLKDYGIRDHQVMKTSYGGVRAAMLLLRRVAESVIMFSLAFPGAALHSPIALIAREYSKKKAEEAKRDSSVKLEGRDVVATWKILVALVLTPLLLPVHLHLLPLPHPLYLLLLRARGYLILLFAIICPMFGYAAVRASEIGFDILRSLRPLFLAIFPSTTEPLRHMRTDLTARLNAVIEDLAPGLYAGGKAEFEKRRLIRPEDVTYSEVITGRMNRSGKGRIL